MGTFQLNMLSAERPFYQGKCTSLVVPISDGQYGIQAGHSNMIAAIIPGMVKITTDKDEIIIAAVSEGMVKCENNQVLLLVDTAERPEEIDEIRARESMEEAKEAMLQKKSIKDYYLAQAKMARALNRLRVKNRN